MNLPEYIELHLEKRFEWGSNDCITFTVGWIEVQTGRDYLTKHKPWRSKFEAHRKLRGLNGLFFLFNQNLKQINPNFARDGDISLYDKTACIFSGRHIVSVDIDGLTFKDRMIAKCAWRF